MLSALVYPGAGHFVLNKYATGVVLAGAFSIPLFFVTKMIFASAQQVADRINAGEIPLDLASITQSITNADAGAAEAGLNIGMYVMVIVWIVGVLDSYRVSKSKIQGAG